MSSFKVGDVVLFTQRFKDRIEHRTAFINGMNGQGALTYEGIRGYGHLETGQGCFFPEEVGQKAFGFHCEAEVIDRLDGCLHRDFVLTSDGEASFCRNCGE